MIRKKLDERVRTLFSHCLRTNQRALLLLVGDHGKDQVPNLYQILHRTANYSKSERATHSNSVLWCYKKELGFSTHRKKRMEKLRRHKKRGMAKQAQHGGTGSASSNQMDNFELFLTNTDITWCYYKDSHRVLGTTHSILVLQDFEALTPNIMARTVETVQGGGLVIFLLRTVKSLRQLYAMTMDVHSRYRTESSGDVVPRFNERFILSLGGCENCLVCDDELNILPLSRKTLNRLTKMGLGSSGDHAGENEGTTQEKHVMTYTTEEEYQLDRLKETLRETPHIGELIELTKTMDQAHAVLTFLEACADRDNKRKVSMSPIATVLNSNKTATVSLTAPRGRGKSAALGLCLAGAISFGFNSIVVTAPEPENLVSVFQFLVEGLNALKYQEHYDYHLGYNYGSLGGSNNIHGVNQGEKAGRDNTKCIVSVSVHGRKGSQQQHRQTVRYARPRDVEKFAGAELVAIDEAAAIPLPSVRKLIRLNPSYGRGRGGGMDSSEERRLTFLCSTTNGYEGTGRALSLKLIKELRESNAQGRARVDAAYAEITGSAKNKGAAKVHEKRWAAEAAAAKAASGLLASSSGSPLPLKEFDLCHPIRYALGDPVEAWLNNLLCLNSNLSDHNITLRGNSGSKNGNPSATKLRGRAPVPVECELYHVNREALFSYHRLSESFLQKLWELYTSAHYKNTPDDLQMLSDAPAHNIFVLLGPTADLKGNKDELPEILAIVQTSLEGKLSCKTIEAQLARGHRSAGDLIPWTMSQQFGDGNFAQLSGARIVRVAVHPAVQGLGYGSRAMELLFRYYNGDMISLSGSHDDTSEDEKELGSGDETASESDCEEGPASNALLHKEALKPRKQLPPLLLPLSSLPTPRLDWLGTSFGLTPSLYNFWHRKVGMTLLYLRQTSNELTGEHSAIMIRALPKRSGWDDAWMPAFGIDARRRICRLLGGPFREMEVSLAVSLLGDVVGGFHSWIMKAGGCDDDMDHAKKQTVDKTALQEVKKRSGTLSTKLTPAELHYHLTQHDLQRLELYSRNLCDHHLISDLIPSLAQLYFTSRMGVDFQLSSVQSALLCGLGLQHKSVDELTNELALPINQVLAMFNKAVKKISLAFRNLLIKEENKGLLGGNALRKAETNLKRVRDAVGKTLEEDVAEGAAAAMEALSQNQSEVVNSGVTGTEMAPEINDPEIMKYTLKGTDEEWASALKDKGEAVDADSMIQIKSKKVVKNTFKRKVDSKGEKNSSVMDGVLKNGRRMKKKNKKKLKK